MSDETESTTETTAETIAAPAPEWAIIEIMGHRRHGGLIQEVERFGAKFVRVDVPGEKDGEVYATHYYSGPSIFSLTPCDEATARKIASYDRPRPAAQYQLTTAERDHGAPEDGDEPAF